MKTRILFPACAAVLAFALSVVCVAQSQSAAPANRSRVQLVHVKPDMLNEWLGCNVPFGNRTVATPFDLRHLPSP